MAGIPSVREIMQADPFFVFPDTKVGDLARELTERHISGAPVVDRDRKLLGVVSLSDIAATEADATNFHRDLWHQGPLTAVGERQVAEIMTDRVLQVPTQQPIFDAVRLLVEHEIHRLVVTEEGQLAGILTTMDVMRYFLSHRRGRF